VSRHLAITLTAAKFLCVKGILFFSFWQSIAVSFLVAVHAIKKVGPYTDAEHMSLALVDSLICFEMPLFAIAHVSPLHCLADISNTLSEPATISMTESSMPLVCL
jgi:hypothetical protein